jgi:hypothetical protein
MKKSRIKQVLQIFYTKSGFKLQVKQKKERVNAVQKEEKSLL